MKRSEASLVAVPRIGVANSDFVLVLESPGLDE